MLKAQTFFTTMERESVWHHGIAVDPVARFTSFSDFVHFNKKKKAVREKLQIFRLLCSRATEVFFLR